MRKLLKETGKRLLGLGPLFESVCLRDFMPYFNWVERRNIYDRGGISGAPSIFDQLHENGVSSSRLHLSSLDGCRNSPPGRKDIRNQVASFYFLYLSEMDMFLHMHCDAPEKVEERLRWYDRGLRRFYACGAAGELLTPLSRSLRIMG